jgi:hypothetical protein
VATTGHGVHGLGFDAPEIDQKFLPEMLAQAEAALNVALGSHETVTVGVGTILSSSINACYRFGQFQEAKAWRGAAGSTRCGWAPLMSEIWSLCGTNRNAESCLISFQEAAFRDLATSTGAERKSGAAVCSSDLVRPHPCHFLMISIRNAMTVLTSTPTPNSM